MPIRKHKKFNRPRKLFDVNLIKEETNLITKYGLKSRREVWRANYAIENLRRIAKSLITAEEDKKQEFIDRQVKKGFNVASIADVLALSKEDYLKRRLQSVVVSKGFAKTHKQARQLIAHKHILLGGNAIDSPSHLTTLDEENALSANIIIKKDEGLSEEDKKVLKAINKNKEIENE